MRKFFNSYEYFWEYQYPFGEDFLKSLFNNNYKRIYSLSGDGIFNIITVDGKIYDITLKKGSSMLINDGKKAFRDENKDLIITIITKELKIKEIEYTVNSGKYITFKYNNNIFKIEVIKKAAMPQ